MKAALRQARRQPRTRTIARTIARTVTRTVTRLPDPRRSPCRPEREPPFALAISCHADTGFRSHRLADLGDGRIRGHLDNFAGVHAVMLAYFTGRLNHDAIRIELTWGEEAGLLGARQVARTLRPDDVVIVVDVTGAKTARDFTVEKCRHRPLERFLRRCLAGLSYRLYRGCPDPVSSVDETDVYIRRCRRVCFLGVPVGGGDYNRGQVTCRRRSIHAVAEALCRIAEALRESGLERSAASAS